MAHFESAASRDLRHPNRSWRADETYVRVAGKWAYLYRAVDSVGDTIDFMLSPKRDLTRPSFSCDKRYPEPAASYRG
jgi:transposase-like protein